MPVAQRLLLTATAARGFQPFACFSCALSGGVADLALLFTPDATAARWGLLLGPSVERAAFDGTRTGVVATVALGARRGLGPWFTVRYHTLSGSGRPTSLAAFLSFQLWP